MERWMKEGKYKKERKNLRIVRRRMKIWNETKGPHLLMTFKLISVPTKNMYKNMDLFHIYQFYSIAQMTNVSLNH